jgi:hypothetical protein
MLKNVTARHFVAALFRGRVSNERSVVVCHP